MFCLETGVASSFNDPKVGTTLAETRGEADSGEPARGEEAKVGDLKGCIENELRLVVEAFVAGCRCEVVCCGNGLCGLGESVP